MVNEDELNCELFEIAFWHLDEYVPGFYSGYLVWLKSRSHLNELDEASRALFVRFHLLEEIARVKAARLPVQRPLAFH